MRCVEKVLALRFSRRLGNCNARKGLTEAVSFKTLAVVATKPLKRDAMATILSPKIPLVVGKLAI
jgi:hypothetical protein